MTVPKIKISEKDYLEQEKKAEHKSEYYNGEIFAMTGATKDHNKIVASLIGSLPSLQNYVVVGSTEYAAEVWARNNDKWILTTAKEKEGTLFLSAIDYSMKLSDIYAQIPEFSK